MDPKLRRKMARDNQSFKKTGGEQCLHEETPQSSQGRADLYTHKAYFIIEHLCYLNVLLNVICWATFILAVLNLVMCIFGSL